MSSNPPDVQSLLHPEGSDLSEASIAVGSDSRAAPFHHRAGYSRMDTNDLDSNPTYVSSIGEDDREGDISTEPLERNQDIFGLGIDRSRPISIQRVPVGARGSPQVEGSTQFGSPPTSTPHTPGFIQPLLSPHWNGQESGYDNAGYDGAPAGSYDNSPEIMQGGRRPRVISQQSNLHHSYTSENNTPFLDSSAPFGTGTGQHGKGCPSNHDIHEKRGSWLSICLLMLSVYSTAWSGVWLATAIIRPRWGHTIASGGPLAPSTASLLIALLAKTIELSFVTVFVGFLGQVLSRRSFVKHSRGVSLAEIEMRQWIIQPGSLLTHGPTLRYAGWSIIGVIALIATLVSMLYTTASDAMISPTLQFGRWEDKTMQGLVRSSYANPNYVAQTCEKLIPDSDDPEYAGSTCLALEHAGQAYHNYITWIDHWNNLRGNSTVSQKITDRPQGLATLYDNVTISANWIQESDMKNNFIKYKRIINNVTMAMPHSGIYAASMDKINGIMQPGELQGLGEYHVRASVPSPSVNVLCANVASSELAPLIYTTWPYAKTNASEIPGRKVPYQSWVNDVPLVGSSNGWLNRTVVDDVFGWGKNYSRRAPVFPMFPLDYNTIVNVSTYQGDTIYILTKASATTDYTLCGLRSFQSPNCSTQYNVTGNSGGVLTAHCEDPNDKLRYIVSEPNVPLSFSGDWTNIASQWAFALSLNDGTLDANASNARLMSQLVPTTPELPNFKPSIAEAIAVLAGCTLLLGTTAAPFVHYWGYNSSVAPGLIIPAPGLYETFNASIQSQQYTSGYSQDWQGVFYIVLFLVFITNIVCLVYFIMKNGLVTDYTETANLFALSINSGPSNGLAGSCGRGPQGPMWGLRWFVKMEEQSGHFYIAEGEDPRNNANGSKRTTFGRRMKGDRSASGIELVHHGDGHTEHGSPEVDFGGRPMRGGDEGLRMRGNDSRISVGSEYSRLSTQPRGFL